MFVKGYVYVLYSRFDEFVVSFLYALAVIAHGVVLSRHEIYGKLLGNSRYRLVRASLFDYFKQHRVTVVCERKSAKGVDFISVHVFGVCGKPVVLRAGGLEFFVIAAESQLGYRLASVLPAAE